VPFKVRPILDVNGHALPTDGMLLGRLRPAAPIVMIVPALRRG